MRGTFTLAERPGDFDALGRAALTFCSWFQVVLRDPPRTAGMLDALERLRPYLERSDERSEWPGTQLLEGKATVNTYRLEPSSLEQLLKLGSAFRDWVEPERPEDVCFLREDGSVWLGSIAHEGDVFLELAPEELGALAEQAPDLVDRLAADSDS